MIDWKKIHISQMLYGVLILLSIIPIFLVVIYRDRVAHIYNDFSVEKLEKENAYAFEMLADILPPPEYIIETYLTAHELLTASDKEKDDFINKYNQVLKRDYLKRIDYWMGYQGNVEIKSLLLEKSAPEAKKFFEIFENKFIPAIKSNDKTLAQQILLGELKETYGRHRAQIDALVTRLGNYQLEIEAEKKSVVSTSLKAVMIIAILYLLTSLTLGFLPVKYLLKQINHFSQNLVHEGDLIQHGNISHRLNPEEFMIDFMPLVTSFNRVADNMGNPLKMVSEKIDSFARGQTPEKISDLGEGEFSRLNENINKMIMIIQQFVEQLGVVLEGSKKGNLAIRADTDRFQGVWRKLLRGNNHILDSVVPSIKEAITYLGYMGNRDFSQEITTDYKGDYSLLKKGVNETIQSINDVLQKMSAIATILKTNASAVVSASEEIAQGATTQASALEEITSNMNEIGNQAKENVEYAFTVQKLSEESQNAANVGSDQMEQMIKAMENINSSSSEIAKVIKVIDEIAFQTNLLALNAAVEAARAGRHGKGFAVVAEEVRNLASRSARAVQETASMIEGARTNIDHGTKVVNSTKAALTQILERINSVNDLVGNITQSSQHQGEGISQVVQALHQIEDITQKNTATSEQSMATAQELNANVREVYLLTEGFTLKNNRSSAHQNDRDSHAKLDLAA